MTDRDTKHLHNLFMIARDIEPMGSSRMAASLVYKNRVMFYGLNQDKTHPFQAQYAKNEEAIYWHAETKAIHNALRMVDENDLKKMTLYVSRAKHPDGSNNLSNKWVWGNSKPCSGCMSCLYKYEVKRIVYSMDEIGHYGVINGSNVNKKDWD
jgi:tRNA(Arg) A34 adenosine deaminase TadA